MTGLYNPTEHYQDRTDLVKKQAWKKREYVKGGGSIIHTEGAGTETEEAVVIQGTSGFHLADNSDAEVHILSGTSDTSNPHALLSLPHAIQREWKEGAGGIQSPLSKDRALEINKKRTYSDDPQGFSTKGGVLHDDGNGNVTIRGNLHVTGSVVFEGSLTVGGNLSVSGNFAIGGVGQATIPGPSTPQPPITPAPAFSA